MIETQPEISLAVKDDDGWFLSKFPKDVDQLAFEVTGVIKDVGRLKQLYDLFAETLNHLCQIGSAYEDNPGIVLK